MPNFLDIIRQSTLSRLSQIKRPEKALENKLDFMQIFEKDLCPIIAEIKFASPSQDPLYKGKLNHIDIAKQYLEHGATALSILTEPNFFKGNIKYVSDIRQRYPDVPMMLKDFVMNEVQIHEALHYGANAILLIASFLDFSLLQRLYHFTLKLNLIPLVEVANIKELKLIESLNPKVIIINNRNLNGQKTNLNISVEMIPQIRSDAKVISASGIKNGKDMKMIRNQGVNGFLIGTAFMTQENPGFALRDILREFQDEG